MDEEQKHDIAVWEPSTFGGSDLLPVASPTGGVEGVPVGVGRENVEQGDMILPTLLLLQGSSDAVKEALKDHQGNQATPGWFMLSTTGEFLEPPLRVLLVQHHRSRALFPQANKPEFQGLTLCLSRDGEEGTEYGVCQECDHRLWRGKEPPLCTEQHNFIAMTPAGPAMMRLGRSSFKAAKKFLTSWTMGVGKNLFSHPVLITAHKGTKQLSPGQSTSLYHMELRWMLGENTPPDYQRSAYELYQRVQEAWEQGRLDSDQRQSDE